MTNRPKPEDSSSKLRTCKSWWIKQPNSNKISKSFTWSLKASTKVAHKESSSQISMIKAKWNFSKRLQKLFKHLCTVSNKRPSTSFGALGVFLAIRYYRIGQEVTLLTWPQRRAMSGGHPAKSAQRPSFKLRRKKCDCLSCLMRPSKPAQGPLNLMKQLCSASATTRTSPSWLLAVPLTILAAMRYGGMTLPRTHGTRCQPWMSLDLKPVAAS